MRTPKLFGFNPWSPFLSPEIALGMLSLPKERRKNRLWQKEFFQRHGLDFESMNFKVGFQNNLSHKAMRRNPVKPLNINLLREVINPDYVKWINYNVGQQGILWDGFWKLQQVPRIGGFIRHLGVKEQRLQAYYAYLTLKPIETVLKKRDIFQSSCA